MFGPRVQPDNLRGYTRDEPRTVKEKQSSFLVNLIGLSIRTCNRGLLPAWKMIYFHLAGLPITKVRLSEI
jgi:hypothetical protein